MNNEQVAYINKDDGLVCAKCFNPLYTHPAKTLTDEEKMKPNYVAEAPYQPGYEDAVVTEPKPFLCGIYKSKPLTNQEITGIRMQTEGDIIAFARAIEKAHGIK
jgi:hypothetical protein